MLGQPWIVPGNDVLIVASETRVFCIDERLAIRWCWTVKVHSNEWWRIAKVPVIREAVVEVGLESPTSQIDIRLRVADAMPL